METNFNFKSQICTTREQSERLIALGLKKETADMCITDNVECAFPCPEDDRFIPAWSLHRLIELIWGEGKYLMNLETHRPFEDCIERIDAMINYSCCFNKEYLENGN